MASTKQTNMLMGRMVEHQFLLKELPVEVAQWGIENPKIVLSLLENSIREGHSKHLYKMMLANEIADWEEFYNNSFWEERHDFSQIMIPERPIDGLWRLLIIAESNLEKIYHRFTGVCHCRRGTDDNLDEIVTWNERDTKNGAYAIWVRGRTEADAELKNLSAKDVDQKCIATETLAERLIHGLKFFLESGGNLDWQNVTLCAGSCCKDNFIPTVHLGEDGRVTVGFRRYDESADTLCARQVAF